ncbi:hypothetical protein HNP55_001076 [Paucibacter oligotrophus]|uniref:Uncharacterized protein n=1 Tax=Roseateles oligotrophus TaxID=1769250 RepID=A0A840L440_9BURK|nr:hypothetical protein [Roseateles oligotrophus]MBB4842561.1 hypothetical protein [Roseateles oligotrophus]
MTMKGTRRMALVSALDFTPSGHAAEESPVVLSPVSVEGSAGLKLSQ